MFNRKKGRKVILRHRLTISVCWGNYIISEWEVKALARWVLNSSVLSAEEAIPQSKFVIEVIETLNCVETF